MTGPVTTNPRKRVVAVRLTEAEGAALDECRGSMSNSDYLRALLKRDIERRQQALLTIFDITTQQETQINRAGEVLAPDGSTVVPEGTL